MELANETPWDKPITDWQLTIDEGVAIIAAARERVEFAMSQRDKLITGRLQWLGQAATQETFDFS